ncbi:MAG: aldose 1-epimerase family protein [Clostridia bacterium]|nr:aldose 1-epimerase family protein [Clostridia bacterium]
MITLKNDFLTVKIAERGAEIKSIVYGGNEYVWCGDPEIWGSSCPLLFPICGGLKEDKYTIGGREYTLEKHGFARRKTFTVEQADDTYAVFLHCSDKSTKEFFPFDYELRVIFTLEDRTVKIDYSIKNCGNTPMFFNIGSHEGYSTPEGIEEYDIVFPQNETLYSTVLDGNLLSNEKRQIVKESNVLSLKEEYFSIDALVFTDIESRTLNLVNRKTAKTVKIDFPDDKYLLLWHKPGARFICVEPWNGIPDRIGSSYDITEKEGITELKENGEFNHTHSITIVK